MIANAGAGNTYAGKIYTTTGSSYLASTFSKGVPQEVGAGVLTFADSGHATFDYTVNGGPPQTKSIVPQQFGTLPTCIYSATANLAGTTNYQGLWWNSNEDGWGINFAHQGAIIFASWFTFDVDGSPLWLVSIMQKGMGETFSGDLLRMTATPFNATPFKKNDPTKVGTATLAFANGNSATFQYTIGSNGTITKQLTHEALAPGGTVCN
jgi:hypothetical protein